MQLRVLFRIAFQPLLNLHLKYFLLLGRAFHKNSPSPIVHSLSESLFSFLESLSDLFRSDKARNPV